MILALIKTSGIQGDESACLFDLDLRLIASYSTSVSTFKENETANACMQIAL